MSDPGVPRTSVLARNMVLNLVGQVPPSLSAVVCVPIALHGLGISRFSILSVAWVLLAYLTVFDLGMSRAEIRFLSAALAEKRLERVATIVWTTVAVELTMGIIAGGLLALNSSFLSTHFLRIDHTLQSETATSLLLLAAMVPFLLTLTGFRAVLETNQRFDLVNLVRTVSSSVLFIIPALGAVSHSDLPRILFWMALSLAATTVTYALLALRICPGLTRMPVIEPPLLMQMFKFGGWVTVSSVVAPLILFADRLLITGLMSVAGLAYYTVPYEITARAQIVPTSFGAVLYPAFSAMALRGVGNAETVRLYARSIKYLLLLMAPLMLAIALCAHVILDIWIDPRFAAVSAPIMELLALGVLLMSISSIPIQLLDAHNRPKLRAIVFIIELALYIPLTVVLINRFGLLGAAISFALRGFFELTAFFVLSWRLSGIGASISHGANGLIRAAALCLILSIPSAVAVVAVATSVQAQLISLVVLVPLVGLFLWRFALDSDERLRVKALSYRLLTASQF